MNRSYDSTSNSTNLQKPFQLALWYSNAYTLTMIILYSLIIIAAILGNILVCIAVVINPILRKNVSVYFVVSLALTDISTACFSMPFDLETFVTYGKWRHSEALCSIWTTAYLITVPTSMWTLFVLSIFRYKMLKNPWDRFRDSPLLTPKRAIVVIMSLWIFCLAMALIPIMGVKYIENPLMYGYCIFNISPIYANVVSFLSFYFPMFAMCYIYYKIYMIAQTQNVIPTGLKTKPNASAVERELPSRGFVQGLEEGHRNDSKTSSKTSLVLAVGNTQIVVNQGLVGNYKDKKDIETLHDRTTEGMENTCADLVEKYNKSMVTWKKEQENQRKLTQTNDGKLRCPSLHHNTSTNSLCGVEGNNDYFTRGQTNSKFVLHTTPDRSFDFSIMNNGLIGETASTNRQFVETRAPVLAVNIVAPSTSGTNRCESNQIIVRSLDEYVSEASNNISELIIPCSSDSKCESKLDESSVQEGHNSLRAASETNLSCSDKDLDKELTKKRKIFVKNKKAARTIAVIVGAFLLCWIPFTTHSVILNFCARCFNQANYKTSQILLVFGYLNSALNPIIFSYKDGQFLKSYRKIIKILFPCSRHCN